MTVPSIDKLTDKLRTVNPPPLHDWRPVDVLDIDLRIDAGGRWFYRDSEIRRRRLVKLFASVLRLEDDGHYLITPRVKYPVAVADAPFMAVEMQRDGAGPTQRLSFRTNTDDWTTADRNHPLRITTVAGQLSPRIEVRAGLQAKLTRAVYFELAQLATPRDAGEVNPGDKNPADKTLGIYSAGEFFPLDRI